MVVKGFHHVAVKAKNFEKSLSFYTEVLGLKLRNEWGEGRKHAVMLVAGDGSAIELFAGGADIAELQSPYIHIAFSVDDPDAFIEKIRNAGYEITVEPKTADISGEKGFSARLAFCKGPDGEVIELFKALRDC